MQYLKQVLYDHQPMDDLDLCVQPCATNRMKFHIKIRTKKKKQMYLKLQMK